MKIRSNHLLNFTNIAAKVLTITLLIIFGISAFKSNNYEVLFIDERMLVDDIYNIWLLDDVFNRFDEVDNILFKNLLIFFIEFAYGGDLRYGRLWSNFFCYLCWSNNALWRCSINYIFKDSKHFSIFYWKFFTSEVSS